jgi:hypothetical protein
VPFNIIRKPHAVLAAVMDRAHLQNRSI